MTDLDVDVLVIGSGAAGLSAALAARQAGAERILVAEGEGIIGGSSRLSGGLMMGAATRYQKAQGIEDSPEALFHDYMTLNQWKVESAVVERLTQRAGAAVEWLGDLGVEFYDQLVFGGDETLPRVHCPIGRGQAVVDVLYRHCRESGVEFALGQRVDRLLVSDGAVVGIAVGEDEITAGSVVIATGGFGADEEKRRELFPSVYDTGWSYYIGADGSRGDALDFTRDVQAQVTGFNRGLRLLHTDFDTDVRGLHPRLAHPRQPSGPALLQRDRSLRDHGRPPAGAGRRRPSRSSTTRRLSMPPSWAWPATSSRSPARRRSRARTGTSTSSR